MATVSPESDLKNALPVLDGAQGGAQGTVQGGAEDRGSSDRETLVFDSLATGVVFALALTVGQRVIGFVRGILFCRLMTDQELGQWSMVWSFLMLLAPLAMLGLPGCFGKYTEHYRQRGQLRIFVSRVAIVSLVMAFSSAATLLMFPEHFAELFFRDSSQTTLVISLAVALVAVAFSNFVISLLESLRQVRMVTLMRFITGIAFAGIGTGLIVVWKDNASAVTIAYGICCLVGLVPAVWWGWKFRDKIAGVGEPLASSAMWKKIAPFAVWLWVSNLLHNLFEVSDRYMLLHWSDTPANSAQALVGQYHSGRVIPMLLVSVAAMLGGVLLPYMSAAWEAGRKEQAVLQLNMTYKLAGLAFTVGGIFVLLLSPFFFDTILQGRYDDGLAVLPMTLVYCIWFSLFTIGQDYLWVAEKGKLATIAVGVGLIVNVGLNIVLIPHWGLSGAVLATMAGNLLVIFFILQLNHRNGCPTDSGVWLVSSAPLLLLLVPWSAAFILGVIAFVSHQSDLIFSPAEKQLGLEAWGSLRSKFNRFRRQ